MAADRSLSSYTDSAEQDVLRRDFTINGMLLDPERIRATGNVDEAVLDFVGGREDLQRGIIRAIGDPRQRFAEDKLRMLRAVRFAARFGFEIEDKTLRAIRAAAPEIRAGQPGAGARRTDAYVDGRRRSARL